MEQDPIVEPDGPVDLAEVDDAFQVLAESTEELQEASGSGSTMAPHSVHAGQRGAGATVDGGPASRSASKRLSFAEVERNGISGADSSSSIASSKAKQAAPSSTSGSPHHSRTSGPPRRVLNLFALTRKNDTRARRASGVADLLLQQPLGQFDVSVDNSRRGSRTLTTNLEMFPSAQPGPIEEQINRGTPELGGHSTLPSDNLPRPSIMDLAFCDLHKIQASFVEHTTVWNQAELLDRFKRLVVRAIKEEEDQVMAEDDGTVERDPVYETALATGFLNGPDVIPVGVPARFLQKARAQLMWEYERRVAGRMEQLQCTKYQNWRHAQQQEEYTRNARFGRNNPLGVKTKDGYLSHALPRGARDSSPTVKGKKQRAAVPRGGDTLPMPTYLTRSVSENRALLATENLTMPPAYSMPWDIDVYDSLPMILQAERRMKDAAELAASLDKAKEEVVNAVHGTDRETEGSDGDDSDATAPPPEAERTKPASKKGLSDARQDIPLPTFVYVVSRILFRMNYMPSFPTGLFNRELIDPWYFPEQEELDTPYFYRYYPRIAEVAEQIYLDRLERLRDQFCGVQPPIEANDFISVHMLLCPPKKKDNSFNDVALPWLHLTEEEEDSFLPVHFTESERVDRRRYREMLQATAQKENLLLEVGRMMTICRLVAFEFFEGIDSTQRGVISWSEFTDALIEHAEVAHHREKAEESMKTMRTCASVFDHYKVESLPGVLLQLGYSAFTVEVKYSGSLIILKGPYDFAVCNGAAGGSIEFKFTVRATKDILEDRAKARILAERAAANGDTTGIGFHDAEASSRPWRNNTKVPGVFIRYIDGKRLDEVAAMSIADQLQKERKEELLRERKEKERLAREAEGLTITENEGDRSGASLSAAEEEEKDISKESLEEKHEAPPALTGKKTTEGKKGDGRRTDPKIKADLKKAELKAAEAKRAEEKKKEDQDPKLPKAPERRQDGVSVRKKDDVEVIAAAQLNDIIYGLPPLLLVLCSDLIFRVYVMISMLVALPETAILRTYETVTCMDWCGASCSIHDELKHYVVCGTRAGSVLVVNIRAALKNMPRLNEARHGVIGSVFNSNAGYADLAGITHQDDLYHYIVFDKTLHKSIVCTVSVSDSGVIVSSSLDGEVCMGRLHYTVHTLEITPMRRFHACDSGVRAALYANIAQVIVVQTVASKIFVYGVANQKVHVELYDPQAPHFFPIISMIVVDDLDQLITADTSGFVKVWSLRRCQPLSSFYALSKAGRVNISDGESTRLYDVDTQGGGSAALTGGGSSGEAKKGMLSTNRRTIEKSVDTALSLAPLRNLAYDYVSHRLFATGLRNSAMCTFVFGQGGARAHMERICFIGISFRHQWIVTMSCSDCRLWTLTSGTMALGIRANNAEYNLLASERLSHLDKSSGHGDGTVLMSNLNDFLEDNHHSMEAIKRMPRSADDVIRSVAVTKVKVNAYKRVPLHIPKSEIPHVRLEMQLSRFSDDPLAGLSAAHGGARHTAAGDMSNQNDNTRNTNVKHGDILCAVVGQHDRLLMYALSTGDIRVHRSDSGRLVKTYVTLPPTTEEVLSAALFYRHLYISSNARGKQDELAIAMVQEGGQGTSMPGAIMSHTSILKSLTSQQRVEAVASLLQRMLTDSKDAVMMAGASRSSFHFEPVNMICLDSSQELVVMYADGVMRYFPLIGTMLTSHKLIIPEFLIVKAVHFFNAPPPTRRRPVALVASASTTSNQPLGGVSPCAGTAPDFPTADLQSTEDSAEETPMFRNNNRHSLTGRPMAAEPTSGQAPMRLPHNLSRSQAGAKESLEALNHALVEADAVSLVAVSTYLQLVCVVQVTGVISIMDISGGGSGATATATSDTMSVPIGANVVHSFTTKEEVTSISFMGAYPCLLVADRFSELHFYLLKGSSTLSLVDDFFKAIVMDRHARYARSVREAMGASLRDGRIGSMSRMPTTPSAKDPGIKVRDTPPPATDKRNSMLPRVWTVRMPPEIGTPLSIHFDPRYSTVYVGTKDGYISSFNVQKFIVAADLSPLCISAAEVSLDTYLLALKQQQQESNEEVIRNFLLILFGLTPADITQYLQHVQQEKMREYLRVRELSKANSHVQISLPPMPEAEPPKWENSLQWVYESCEALLRGQQRLTFTSEDTDRDFMKPLVDLDDVSLTDLLLATTIMHDATRLISLRQQVKNKPLSSGRPVSGVSGSGSGTYAKASLDPTDPALVFLRMRENKGDDAEDESHQMSKSVVLRRSDIHQIRRWIKQALHSTSQPPLVDPTKPWNCGWRTYRRTSSMMARQNSASSDTVRGGKQRPLLVLPSTEARSSFSGVSEEEEDHLIVSRWVEPLFQRHAMFMSDNCPLTLLSPFGTMERARREKQEREKAMLQSTQNQASTLEQAAAEAEADNSPQNLRKGNWDEFVEGIIPRVQPAAVKQGGVLQEMERLLASDMGVIRILTRRNGYVFVGLEDGSVSVWTPYACARVAQVCSSLTLPASILHLGEAIKNQFAQLYELITLQRQRIAFEADGMLGRNAAEGESKIKAKIKSMLVNHQLQKIKKETAKEEAEAEAAAAGIEGPLLEKKESFLAVISPRNNPEASSMHPATFMMERHLEEVRDIMQLYCGYQSKEDFASKHLYIEDLFFLPMRMADLMEIETLEPSWYQNAVDLSIDRLLFDICGNEASNKDIRKDYHRKTIYQGLTNMSTPTLVSKGDPRLVVAMLNYVLETPATHEVDFINFTHDHLLSLIGREEVSEFMEMQRLNRKVAESRQQGREQSSWTRRLRGTASNDDPLAAKSTDNRSYISSIMEALPSGNSGISISLDGTSSSDGQPVSTEEMVRLRALQLRVGAVAQLGEEQHTPNRAEAVSSATVHPSRRRSMIRRSLVAVDPTPHSEAQGPSPHPHHSYGEGALHKMAVERCIHTAPSAGANDISAQVALQKRIAALGPNRPQTSAPYEKVCTNGEHGKDADGKEVHALDSNSSASDSTEEDPMKISPARAEAWLYSSTYSHNQPLLLVSREEGDQVRTNSLSILDAGKTQALNLDTSAELDDLGATTDRMHSPFNFLPTNIAFESTTDSASNSPRIGVSPNPIGPPGGGAGVWASISSLKKSSLDVERVPSNNGTVAFVAPVFLTETASPSSPSHTVSKPPSPQPRIKTRMPSNLTNTNNTSSSISPYTGAMPASNLHQMPAFLRGSSDVGANSSNRLPVIRWQLSQKKKTAKLNRTGWCQQVRPSTGPPLVAPPTSNTFVPRFAQPVAQQAEDRRPQTTRAGTSAGEGMRTVSAAGRAPGSGRLGALGGSKSSGGATSNMNNTGNPMAGITDRGAPQRDNRKKKKSLADLLLEAAEEKHAQTEEALLGDPSSDPITDVRGFLGRGAHPNPHPHPHHSTTQSSHAISFIRRKCIGEVLPGPQHAAEGVSGRCDGEAAQLSRSP